MKVFERMQSVEVRQAFCAKKTKHLVKFDDEETNQLCTYIMSEECVSDIKRLMEGDYYTGIPSRFYIRKTATNRRRVCYRFPLKDKFLLKLMAYVLMDFDFWYTDSLYSFRKDMDHRHFFKKLKALDPNRELYVLKMDVHSYGESLDQDILLECMEPMFKEDPEIFSYLKWLIKRNQFYFKGKLHTERISIQPGIPVGGLMNNVYLMEMDRYVEAHSRLYMRYSDDIAVFLDSYEECIEMKNYILSVMDEKKLIINEDKTAIYAPGEAFEILGIRVEPNQVYDIARNSVSKILFKMKRKTKRLLKKVQRKRIPKDKALFILMKYVNQYFYGCFNDAKDLNWTRWSYGIITTDETLKFIDNYVQNCLRAVASGKGTNARYRVTYSDLKEAGYISLVHSYHHGYDDAVQRYIDSLESKRR
jgi:hypothetical protein